MVYTFSVVRQNEIQVLYAYTQRLINKDTMTKHPFYKKLWEYVEAINHYE